MKWALFSNCELINVATVRFSIEIDGAPPYPAWPGEPVIFREGI
jgi:hypothetical protein